MSQLIERSLYRSMANYTAPVITRDFGTVGQVQIVRPPYEVYYEAKTPNDKSLRRYLHQGEDLTVDTERELLVEIDKEKLQGLVMWKPFQHYKRWYDFNTQANRNFARMGGYTFDGASFAPLEVPLRACDDMFILGLFDATSRPNAGLDSWFDQNNEAGDFIPEPDDLDALVQASLKSLLPRVKTKVQLINSLIELKDFVTLKRTITRIKQLGLSLAFKRAIGTLREVAGTAADVFLQWNFNLKPLIRDIEGIHQSLVNSLGRMRRLMQVDGSPQVTYYRRSLSEPRGLSIKVPYAGIGTCDLSPTFLAFEGGQVSDMGAHRLNVEVYRQVMTVRDVFSAQLRFVARWSALQHRYAEQLGLVDALGLSFNPKHVWDALPWSFVIDWVVKVGDFLDQYARGALDPVLDVIDYSWSVSRERHIDLLVKATPVDGFVGPPIDWIVYPTLKEVAYRRQPLVPGEYTPIVSSLNSHELRLAAALVISRKRKLRKPKRQVRWRSKRH